MTSASDEKWRPFNCFFQSREQVIVRRGQIRRIGWVIKTIEAHLGQSLLGCKCPVSWGIVVQEQDHLGDLPAAFLLQNILQLHQQRWVILRVVILALWKIINEEDAVLIPKKSRRELFQRIFVLGIFWVGVSRYTATPLIVALSPGHNDITRFRPWSPIATRNHPNRAKKKFQNLLSRMAPLAFMIRVRAFRDPLRGEISHVQIFMNDATNSLTWDAQLLSYWFSRNPVVFQDWVVNLIHNSRGCHCFWGLPGRGTSQVEKSQRLNWTAQFLTVAWDCACSPNVSVRTTWISFVALPCRKK